MRRTCGVTHVGIKISKENNALRERLNFGRMPVRLFVYIYMEFRRGSRVCNVSKVYVSIQLIKTEVSGWECSQFQSVYERAHSRIVCGIAAVRMFLYIIVWLHMHLRVVYFNYAFGAIFFTNYWNYRKINYWCHTKETTYEHKKKICNKHTSFFLFLFDMIGYSIYAYLILYTLKK